MLLPVVNAPPPAPNSTPAFADPGGPYARSSIVSSLKSPTARAVAGLLIGVPATNVPLPLPRRILMLCGGVSAVVATAMSSRASLLKSPITSAVGL